MIRQARLTDRQGLKELSELARSGAEDRHTLGLPGPRPGSSRLSLSALIPSWMPLRQASLHLVAEDRGRIVGSCRAVEEPRGGDWTVVELDAAPEPFAAEVRYELLSALLHEGGHHEVARYHAACSDVPENLELFAQQEFVAYASEEILYRPADAAGPQASPAAKNGQPATNGAAPPTALAGGVSEPAALRRAESSDAWHLFRLWSRVTPPVVARTEGYSAADWEVADREASVPRSSLTPLLRPADVRAWLLPDASGAAAFVQLGSARGGPQYLRLMAADDSDPASVLQAALDEADGPRRATEWLAAVRSYEPRVRTALLRDGFEPIGTVHLLVRDARARVRQPAFVPAIQ